MWSPQWSPKGLHHRLLLSHIFIYNPATFRSLSTPSIQLVFSLLLGASRFIICIQAWFNGRLLEFPNHFDRLSVTLPDIFSTPMESNYYFKVIALSHTSGFHLAVLVHILYQCYLLSRHILQPYAPQYVFSWNTIEEQSMSLYCFSDPLYFSIAASKVYLCVIFL